MVAYEEGKSIVDVPHSAWPMTEAAASTAVIIVGVLGLAKIAPATMIAVGTIAVGAALLLQGANIVSGYSALIVKNGPDQARLGELGGGLALEFLAGGVGVVLGLLALLTSAAVATSLTAAALVVFGGTLLIASGRSPQVAMRNGGVEGPGEILAHDVSSIATSAQLLIGLATLALGVLALSAVQATVLSLAGLIAVGTSLLLADVAVSVGVAGIRSSR